MSDILRDTAAGVGPAANAVAAPDASVRLGVAL